MNKLQVQIEFFINENVISMTQMLTKPPYVLIFIAVHTIK